MSKKISIIVPVYNTFDYLEKCIFSICNQSYKDLEIIIVDDGSKDLSPKLCDQLAKKDNRIKVIHKANGGLSDARNIGIRNATGKYLSFIDSDDYIENGMYEYLINNMEKYDCDIGICGWYLVRNEIRNNCSFISKERVLSKEECIDALLCKNSFDNFMCNKIFKRDLFNNIEFPVGKKMEDLATLYKLIHRSYKIYTNSKPFYNYVLRDGSITSNLFNQIDVLSFQPYIDRKNFLLENYPNLKNRILSNYFTACRMNLIIAYNSKNRNEEFEKDREKDLKLYRKYVLFDNSLSIRNKISFILSSLNPKLFFKVRFRKNGSML